MSDNQNEEPYNGAAYGYSPFDMDLNECLGLDEWGDYDPCDDAEDYGEETDDED